MVNQVRLNALDKFKCTGSACPQNCCTVNWEIEVDPPTLVRWQESPELLNGKSLNQCIKSVTKEGKTLATLLKANNNTCILLDNDRLCSLQSNHGHEYLPATCRDYPRARTNSELLDLDSAVLSCPEITRLVLFDKTDEPVFSSTENKPYLSRYPGDASPAYIQIKYSTGKFVNAVLREKKYGLNIRLFYLTHAFSSFHSEMQKIGYTKALAKKYFATVKTDLLQIHTGHKAGEIRLNPATAGSYWRSVFMLISSRKENFQGLEIDRELEALCRKEDDSHEHFGKIYELICGYAQKYEKYIGKQKSQVYERYILVSLITKKFPYKKTEFNMTAILVASMSTAAAIQLMIWMHVDGHSTLSDEVLQKIIYRTEGLIGHSVKGIVETLKEDPHMLMLEKYAEVFLDVFC